MRKFRYLQIEYNKYPSPEDLNKEGGDDWEVIEISPLERLFYNEVLDMFYDRKVYVVTFKKEIIC